jgi:hypothetical protein
MVRGGRGGRRRPGAAVAVAACALLGAAALGGCAGAEQTGTPAHRVATWVDGGGGSGIGNVEVAIRNVDLALSKHDQPAAIREVCSLLSNEAQTSIGNLPAPDDALTTQLDDAYTVATSAGDDCYQGAGGDAALLARSARERVRAVSLLAVAVDHIRSVTGHTPTTETTAPQGGGDPFGGGT